MRVLIADDDVTSRLMLEAVVSKLGHECLVAHDGSRAWEVLCSEPIDVLLTDWLMPGIDGPELCRRVRHELNDSYTYVVLVTRIGHPELILEGMGSGADDYLIKPADPFAVQTRMVAAERVTTLHRQLVSVRSQLEHANLELLGQSLTDALTGLGNRRRMEEDLERTHARAQRAGRAYAMALFDIDHFKLYNDHHGHPAGDEALRRVAQCLDKFSRTDETVYRYGGEEFLLLLPDCSVEDAATAARRLRRSVAAMELPHNARPTTPPVVTLSGGVSCWVPGSPLCVADLLQRADDALFQAKAAGRNRVHIATQQDGELEPAPVGV